MVQPEQIAGGVMTVSEAARVLGLEKNRVRTFIKEGRLQAAKYGPIYLLLQADVEAFRKQPRRPGRRPKVAA